MFIGIISIKEPLHNRNVQFFLITSQRFEGSLLGYKSLLFLFAGGVSTPRVVGGGEQHGEEQQQGHQQVGDVYGGQQPALLRRPGTRRRFPGKRMEKDVTQDGDQRGGSVGGVHDGGSPDPPTATWGVKKKVELYFLFLMVPVFFFIFSTANIGCVFKRRQNDSDILSDNKWRKVQALLNISRGSCGKKYHKSLYLVWRPLLHPTLRNAKCP